MWLLNWLILLLPSKQEQTFSLLIHQLCKAILYISSRLVDRNYATNCRTSLSSVPRVWEKMQEGIMAVAGQTTGLKKKIAEWAKSIGAEGTYA
jgi:long-subunit acyl-CoA synthetase (AMP-forming)